MLKTKSLIYVPLLAQKKEKTRAIENYFLDLFASE